jgi:hypothetical protein
LLAVAAAGGCGSGLPSASQITNLRVIGLQADPPAAEVGTQVALTSLVMDNDRSAAIDLAWVACVETKGASPFACAEGGTIAMPQLCANDPEAPLCFLGADPSETYTIPALARAGRAATEDGQVVITLIAATNADGGVFACVNDFMAQGAPPDYCRVAVKRIDVVPSGTPATSMNHNPGVVSLVAGPGDPSPKGDPTVRLQATLASDAVEQTATGPEQLYYSWYVTTGSIDKFRTDGDDGLMNTWTFDDPMAGSGTFTAAFVVRDGRGGESWTTVDVAR